MARCSWYSSALVLSAFVAFALGSAPAAEAAHTIPKPGLTIEIKDYFRMPITRPPSIPLGKKTPDWRINFLREEPGGSDRLFVSDLYGQLYSVDKSSSPGNTMETEYLNLNSVFSEIDLTGSFAAGFVTFAFHPDFANNGKFYTVHSEDPHSQGPGETPEIDPPGLGSPGSYNVLVEWTAADPAANIFSGTRRELMRLGSATPTHPMGDLTFNPLANPGDDDYGLLYISVGDGQVSASGTQRLDTLRSSILRIDPDPAGQPIVSSNGEYSIPADNPWASDGDPNTFGEILAYGFRNIHRISWDTETGDLYGMDIGQKEWEEVNRIVPGRNYGWRDREGNTLEGGGALPPNDADLGYTYPVAQYNNHPEGFPVPTNVAISSGFAYRGRGVPSLQGKFIFGDIPNGKIFFSDIDEMLAADDGDPNTMAQVYELQIVYNGQNRELLDIVRDEVPTAGRADLRLAVDGAGELYVMTKQDGWVRRVVLELILGDMDCDGNVDFDDIGDFVLGLSNAEAYENLHGLPPEAKGDMDNDGDFDFDDIPEFVAVLFGGAQEVPEPSTFVLAIAGLLAAVGGRRKGVRWRFFPLTERIAIPSRRKRQEFRCPVPWVRRVPGDELAR